MSSIALPLAAAALLAAAPSAQQASSPGAPPALPPAPPPASRGAASVTSPGGPVSSLAGLGSLFFNEDGTGTLWTLSTTNGSATSVGQSGVNSDTVGLAPRDATTLYGSIWADIAIVRADGSGATVLSGSAGAEGLAYDAATGTLYGAINGQFFTLDTATGVMAASLAAPPGDVEGIAVGNGGVYGLVGFGGSDTSLHFYSFASATWTVAGDTGIDWERVGLAYDPNTMRLYAKGGQSSLLYRIDPATGATTVVGDTGLTAGGGLAWHGPGTLGTSYCTPAVRNSTGVPGVLSAHGSPFVAANDVTLRASSLPLHSFGIFLTSRTQGSVAQPGGSQGILCLGGAIGRYVGPGQIQNTGNAGAFHLPLDLTRTPTPTALIRVAVGETWNFQAWHRDAVGGTATSNFTDGVAITFL